VGIVLLWCLSNTLCLAKKLEVQHEPQEPKSGQAVQITAKLTDASTSESYRLEYQVVEPGKYIALRDPAFQNQWTALKMQDAAGVSSSNGNERLLTVQLPPDLQKNRRLIRYRIHSVKENKIVAPEPTDSQPNYAYFVYDGVPDWKGALDPDGLKARVRQVVTYPSEALQRVAVYQFISSQRAVEGATWTDPDEFGDPKRNAYKYTGTLVYEGVVYDHVGFRARGGTWRHAMGKNMWKFDFRPGHHLAARDFYGKPYEVKWGKLNLGACIQQGDYGMRGEQGMFEAVGFRLFNLAGIEAPRTHWVHLRIVDQSEESPLDQYSGDFWGLYLAVENVDERFLKEHHLPPGNVYKIQGDAKVEFNGDPSVTDQRDVRRFMSSIMHRQPDSWWQTNVDLARYYNYRSIIECIHHYDLDAGKNYFYYLNPQSHQWIVIPWDIDLTWGDEMFGGGGEPFYQVGLLRKGPFKQQYQERLAEIRDLLFNAEQTGRLIDEYAAMISDPSGQPSIAGADRAKWDYNPVMESTSKADPSKAGIGRFYFGLPENDFRAMVKYMKSYVAKRAQWIDTRLLSDYRPIKAPKIAQLASPDFSAPSLPFPLESTPETDVQACRWRLAEVTDPASPCFNPHEPWQYEIQSIWEKELKDLQTTATVPTSLLKPGHTYRTRVRLQNANGTWSRWSGPMQFSVPAK
jgi:hypothetical protein